MTPSSHPTRWLALLLALFVSLTEPSPLLAAEAHHAVGSTLDSRAAPRGTAPSPIFAGIMDSIVGNRQRMIRFAFIGFAIGVAILMTATRKH